MQSTSRSIFGVLAAALFLAACGGDSATGVDDGGNDDTPNPPTREVKNNPSFENDIREMFMRKGCTAAGCHGTTQSAGLDLATNPYANLVNVQSQNCGTLIRVVPNDAANSYIVAKVQANPPCGSRMPLNGATLDDTDLANLINWINTGALNN